MDRRRRVLHVLKLYRPMFTGEGVFTERCVTEMQAMMPEVEHDLLVTVTPAPEQALPICSPLREVFYLNQPSAPAWRHDLGVEIWLDPGRQHRPVRLRWKNDQVDYRLDLVSDNADRA